MYFISEDCDSVRVCPGVKCEDTDHEPWYTVSMRAAVCSDYPFNALPPSQPLIPSTGEPDHIRTACPCYHGGTGVRILRSSHHVNSLFCALQRSLFHAKFSLLSLPVSHVDGSAYRHRTLFPPWYFSKVQLTSHHQMASFISFFQMLPCRRGLHSLFKLQASSSMSTTSIP